MSTVTRVQSLASLAKMSEAAKKEQAVIQRWNEAVANACKSLASTATFRKEIKKLSFADFSPLIKTHWDLVPVATKAVVDTHERSRLIDEASSSMATVAKIVADDRPIPQPQPEVETPWILVTKCKRKA